VGIESVSRYQVLGSCPQEGTGGVLVAAARAESSDTGVGTGGRHAERQEIGKRDFARLLLDSFGYISPNIYNPHQTPILLSNKLDSLT